MRNIKKAIFLGSKEFGLTIFKSLYECNNEIDWIILCPSDLNDSRSYFEHFNNFAKKNNIELKKVKKISSVDQVVDKVMPDILFVVGFYQILPSYILNKIPEGVWGIHNSILPKYRGSSPLVWQLINDEDIIGSSLFKFSEGMDDGDILHQVSFKNSSNYNIQTATKELEKLWCNCLPDIWKRFINKEIQPFKQDHSQATYCAKRNPNDGLIDWTQSASYIDRFIRAQSNPYPMAFFLFKNKVVHVVEHELDSKTIYGLSGQVFQSSNSHVTICCGGNTAIRIIEVEVDGKIFPASKILGSISIRL